MATWEETAQQWGGELLKGAIDREFYQEYNLDKMRLQALGDLGYYDEGAAGVAPVARQGLGIPPAVLLIGGAVLLVLLLKS